MTWFFAAVALWLLGWGALLLSLLLRGLLLPSARDTLLHNAGRRGRALTLLDTTEIEA